MHFLKTVEKYILLFKIKCTQFNTYIILKGYLMKNNYLILKDSGAQSGKSIKS